MDRMSIFTDIILALTYVWVTSYGIQHMPSMYADERVILEVGILKSSRRNLHYDTRNFYFMIQSEMVAVDHTITHLDISEITSNSNMICISLLNKTVRAEMLRMICCREFTPARVGVIMMIGSEILQTLLLLSITDLLFAQWDACSGGAVVITINGTETEYALRNDSGVIDLPANTQCTFQHKHLKSYRTSAATECKSVFGGGEAAAHRTAGKFCDENTWS
ncbi:hypothetical protein NECAME_15991 [Necator americanus]|uniref:Uncharacterized protein n=1 Tax=Necator americanus TaxID=51031 RepID=W2SGZ2_NECAM|nr:hypothetical protein NECAME_15991 [Necator americanus]ETN68161.1 hypothetical protein NECAME_15991 [Necator americanus]